MLFTIAYSSYRPIKSAAIDVPKASEFTAYMEARAEQRSEAADSTSTQHSTSRQDRLSAILKKHKLLGTDLEYRLLLNQIESLREKLDSDDLTDFLNEFDRFVGRQQNKLIAADWFCAEFEFNFEAREQQRRADELHNSMVTGRLSLLATSAITMFGGLIGFMILPLLIRIEANTRNGGISSLTPEAPAILPNSRIPSAAATASIYSSHVDHKSSTA